MARLPGEVNDQELKMMKLPEQKYQLVGFKGLAIDLKDNRPDLRPLREACLRSYINLLPYEKHALGPERNLPYENHR